MNAMPSKDKPISRRTFLERASKALLAGASLIGLGALVRYLGYQGADRPPGIYDLGPASAYPAGSRTTHPESQAMVIHDDQGYRVLSLVCPHLGCMVSESEDGFTCPCHGSHFTSDGSLKKGPASHPLTTLEVEVNADGHLVVYTG
jgi:cytochrome b6-f complex iron-sulfur subunit